MIFPRSILKSIKEQILTREIVVVTGMRRVGKTTLLKIVYDEIKSENKVFLDIENILEQKIFEEIDFNNIWANLKPFGISNKEKAYIFIDEVQLKPEIIKPIKYLYDHYDVKFFITGSSSFYLKNLFPESLAGRKIIFELFPLSFEEFLVFKDEKKYFYNDFDKIEKNKNLILHEKFKKLYEEYIYFGGFPQVVLSENESGKRLFLKDIFNSYFEKEVMLMADFRLITAFRDLLLLLMQRVGSKLEVSKLSSEIGVSRHTITSYISFLQGTYFIFLISPFSRNVDREVSGTKKIYLCDNGIINQFGKISDGSLIENSVFLNIRKYGKVNYYQKRSGSEIDFILPEKGISFEVKKRAVSKDYKKLSKLSESIRIKKYFVISQIFSKEKGIIPVEDI